MPETAAILGAGDCGAAWAARLALMGWHVRIFDPEPAAMPRVADTLAKAQANLPAIYDVGLPEQGRVEAVQTLSEAVAGAVWVQDGTSDRPELKRALFQRVQAACDSSAVLAVSSRTLSAEALQTCATRPGQVLRVVPLDPVYLIPHVTLEPGPATDPQIADRAAELLRSVGMAPVATAPDPMSTALNSASDDAARVTMLRALKACGEGPGLAVLDHEARLMPPAPDPDETMPPVTLDRPVPVTWVDYNGHMNETHFLTAFCAATDRLLLWAGMDAACVAAGHSVFTVETHIRHLQEVDIGQRIQVITRVLQGGGKKLHVWHELTENGRLCATGEQLLLHVDLSTRRSCSPTAAVGGWLGRAAAAHAGLPKPEGLGRFVGQRV